MQLCLIICSKSLLNNSESYKHLLNFSENAKNVFLDYYISKNYIY